MSGKKKTIDEKIEDLAVMVEKGFSRGEAELHAVEKRLTDRFDRIEFHMSTHERRIEILEDKMRIVSTKLGLKR